MAIWRQYHQEFQQSIGREVNAVDFETMFMDEVTYIRANKTEFPATKRKLRDRLGDQYDLALSRMINTYQEEVALDLRWSQLARFVVSRGRAHVWVALLRKSHDEEIFHKQFQEYQKLRQAGN